MRKIIIASIIVLQGITAFAQMSVEEINRRLDTQPYFQIRLSYMSEINVPDSTKTKIIKCLNRELPKAFADSVFTIPPDVIRNIETMAWQRCKTDTVCFHKEYERLYLETIQKDKNNYYNKCLSGSLVLACGSWGITEAIPYLRNELNNAKCDYIHEYIRMALAKLGDESALNEIKESRSLAAIMSKFKLDTLDKNNRIYQSVVGNFPYYFDDFLANYFQDKSFLYDMLELVYLKGEVPLGDHFHTSIENSILFNLSSLFQKHPDFIDWMNLCSYYSYLYLDAVKDKKLYREISSYAYKTEMIKTLRQWIDEHISYE